MQIIMAGGGSSDYGRYVASLGMTKLWSALNEKDYINTYGNLFKRVMVDSGAYSWNRNFMAGIQGGASKVKLPPLKNYCRDLLQFYIEHDKPGWVLVEMDVYSNLSMANVDALANEYMSHIKNATYLRVYHPLLDNGDLSVLKKWLDQGHRYIGLGNDSRPFMPDIFRLTKDRIKYHGFACTSYEIVCKYPFYSVDSTTALSPAKYGGAFINSSHRPAKQLHKDRHPLYTKLNNSSYDAKLRHGVDEFYKRQAEVTKLWAYRGVIWEDD